jgi:hypothetical protein
LYNGAFICKSAVPRYVANGDGTATDNTTGLMWEQQTSTCGGEVTCVNNTYTWTSAPYGSSSSPADGSLFTVFLATLNGGDYYSPSTGLNLNAYPGTCLANHCDWRMPTVAELNSIQSCGANPSTCLDPTFGPTQAAYYWSSSSTGNYPPPSYFSYVWIGNFVYGSLTQVFAKFNPTYARAVRGGR